MRDRDAVAFWALRVTDPRKRIRDAGTRVYDRPVEIVELRPGLHRWELPHPEWVPRDAEGGGWEEVVAAYALESDDGLLLIDPLAPPAGSVDADAFWGWVDERVQALGGGPHVLITIFWHARSSQEVLDRYDKASVWAYEAARELVSERTEVTDGFRPGDVLPGGAVGYHAGRALELVLWLPSHAALVTGDVLLGSDEGARLCPRSWLGGDRSYDDVRDALAPVLELPVELLLLTHGAPVMSGGRDAVERALAAV